MTSTLSHRSVASLGTLLMLLACATQKTEGEPASTATVELEERGKPPPGAEGRDHGPPPEAIEACKGKSEGDGCQVKHGDREEDGTCAKPPPGAPDQSLSCRPVHPPGPGREPPPRT